MSVAAEPDLFGFLAPAAPAPAARVAPVEHVPAPPSLEWARLLTRHGPLPVWVHVSPLWTGVILETLCAGAAGRWGIRSDKTLCEFPPDSGCRARIVYLDPAFARRLHRTHPMTRLGPGGTHAILFRFTAPGEAAPAALDIPGRGGEPA